jgi:hypothetical protein
LSKGKFDLDLYYKPLDNKGEFGIIYSLYARIGEFMGIEKPGKTRSKIMDRGSGIDIIIPSKKSIFAIIFLPFWLVVWLFALITVGGGYFEDAGPPGFPLIWLIAWSVGGIFAILMFLWNVAGREIASFDITSFTLTKNFGFIKFGKKYTLGSCENFRVDPTGMPSSSNRSPFEMLGYGIGRLAFDYGMKTVKFGSGIDEAEAAYIIRLLKDRGFIKKQ